MFSAHSCLSSLLPRTAFIGSNSLYVASNYFWQLLQIAERLVADSTEEFTAALDRLPVAVSGRPPRSITCRRRIRVFRATGEPAISLALRSLAIRIAV